MFKENQTLVVMATWRQAVWFTPGPLEQMYASAAPVNMLAPEYTFDELTSTAVLVTTVVFHVTGRELRSGVKCIVVTIVTGSLWLVRRYRWGQVNLKTISKIPSH